MKCRLLFLVWHYSDNPGELSFHSYFSLDFWLHTVGSLMTVFACVSSGFAAGPRRGGPRGLQWRGDEGDPSAHLALPERRLPGEQQRGHGPGERHQGPPGAVPEEHRRADGTQCDVFHCARTEAFCHHWSGHWIHVFVRYFVQGITLKMNESNHCIVARIMHGGMIHRQGTDIHAYATVFRNGSLQAVCLRFPIYLYTYIFIYIYIYINIRYIDIHI